MKIAIFSDCYLDLTGGIRTSIDAQKKALEARGHTVYVFSTGYQRGAAKLKKLARERIFVVPSCWLCFRGLTPVSRRPRVVEKWVLTNFPELAEFDVIYVHYEAGCSIAGLRLARKLGVLSVQVMHGREDVGETNIIPFGFRTIVAKFLNWCHAWYLPHNLTVSRDNYLADSVAKAKMWTLMVNHANFANIVVTPSEHFRKKLLHYGVVKPIRVLPNGYPDEKFLEKASVRGLAKKETLRMVWHSRVSAEKRMMPFLEALRIVKEGIGDEVGAGAEQEGGNGARRGEGAEPKFVLDVYGGGGDYFRAKRFVRRHKLPVRFHGNAPFAIVQKVMARAHLDVLVSYNFDTFGMTLIEAEAQGVPVFFCDPDLCEVVPDGGYILSAGPTAAEMAAALTDLLARPERVREMSLVMLEHRHEVLVSRRVEAVEEVFRRGISSGAMSRI